MDFPAKSASCPRYSDRLQRVRQAHLNCRIVDQRMASDRRRWRRFEHAGSPASRYQEPWHFVKTDNPFPGYQRRPARAPVCQARLTMGQTRGMSFIGKICKAVSAAAAEPAGGRYDIFRRDGSVGVSGHHAVSRRRDLLRYCGRRRLDQTRAAWSPSRLMASAGCQIALNHSAAECTCQILR